MKTFHMMFIALMYALHWTGSDGAQPPANCPQQTFFVLGDRPLSYLEAQQYCSSRFTSLATISSSARNFQASCDCVTPPCWIGASPSQGRWVWQADHSSLNYSNWAAGFPFSVNQNIETAFLDGNGTWQNTNSLARLFPLCNPVVLESYTSKLVVPNNTSGVFKVGCSLFSIGALGFFVTFAVFFVHKTPYDGSEWILYMFGLISFVIWMTGIGCLMAGSSPPMPGLQMNLVISASVFFGIAVIAFFAAHIDLSNTVARRVWVGAVCVFFLVGILYAAAAAVPTTKHIYHPASHLVLPSRRDRPSSPICSSEPLFIVGEKAVGYSSAEQYCVSRGTSLAKISTAWTDYQANCECAGECWLGAVYSRGKWMWQTDNAALTYTNWHAGFPAVLNGEASVSYLSQNGRWKSVNPTANSPQKLFPLCGPIISPVSANVSVPRNNSSVFIAGCSLFAIGALGFMATFVVFLYSIDRSGALYVFGLPSFVVWMVGIGCLMAGSSPPMPGLQTNLVISASVFFAVGVIAFAAAHIDLTDTSIGQLVWLGAVCVLLLVGILFAVAAGLPATRTVQYPGVPLAQRIQPVPSRSPTTSPTAPPSTSTPTSSPSIYPSTNNPSTHPTYSPTSSVPTLAPTDAPSVAPTVSPGTSSPSVHPTTPSPTVTNPTQSPLTRTPSMSPSTSAPSNIPSTSSPSTSHPSNHPSTSTPTLFPTWIPTRLPTLSPTVSPTKKPTTNPTPHFVHDTLGMHFQLQSAFVLGEIQISCPFGESVMSCGYAYDSNAPHFGAAEFWSSSRTQCTCRNWRSSGRCYALCARNTLLHGYTITDHSYSCGSKYLIGGGVRLANPSTNCSVTGSRPTPDDRLEIFSTCPSNLDTVTTTVCLSNVGNRYIASNSFISGTQGLVSCQEKEVVLGCFIRGYNGLRNVVVHPLSFDTCACYNDGGNYACYATCGILIQPPPRVIMSPLIAPHIASGVMFFVAFALYVISRLWFDPNSPLPTRCTRCTAGVEEKKIDHMAIWTAALVIIHVISNLGFWVNIPAADLPPAKQRLILCIFLSGWAANIVFNLYIAFRYTWSWSQGMVDPCGDNKSAAIMHNKKYQKWVKDYGFAATLYQLFSCIDLGAWSISSSHLFNLGYFDSGLEDQTVAYMTQWAAVGAFLEGVPQFIVSIMQIPNPTPFQPQIVLSLVIAILQMALTTFESCRTRSLIETGLVAAESNSQSASTESNPQSAPESSEGKDGLEKGDDIQVIMNDDAQVVETEESQS